MTDKPCPLCGRDMTAIETHPGRGELYCGHCDLTIGGNDAKTPDELIELLGQMTCEPTSKPPVPKHATGCSKCGEVWDNFYNTCGWMGPPKFCPRCGCKVVSHDG